jgi:hypothetical protein
MQLKFVSHSKVFKLWYILQWPVISVFIMIFCILLLRNEHIQGEHKITLHFQNDTENKWGILRSSHLHQSIEKLSKFCMHLTETQYVCSASHMADVKTIIQFVPDFVQSVPCFCKCTLSAQISCTRHKWTLGWVVPCEIVCKMHIAKLLQTLSLLTAEHTNSSVVG